MMQDFKSRPQTLGLVEMCQIIIGVITGRKGNLDIRKIECNDCCIMQPIPILYLECGQSSSDFRHMSEKKLHI